MNFISETDVEEAKKKRAEEWKIAREEGREIPEEEPEQVRDNRPLYEKLKEQKDKKQEEFEDKLRFKNMIYKGLDETDADFLNQVAERQAAMDGKRFENESAEIAEFRAAAEKLPSQQVKTEESTTDTTVNKTKIGSEYLVDRKSQATILASAIIRKRKSSVDSTLHEESEKLPEKQSRLSYDENPPKLFPERTISNANSKEGTKSTSLSLLADYPSSSSENESD